MPLLPYEAQRSVRGMCRAPSLPASYPYQNRVCHLKLSIFRNIWSREWPNCFRIRPCHHHWSAHLTYSTQKIGGGDFIGCKLLGYHTLSTSQWRSLSGVLMCRLTSFFLFPGSHPWIARRASSESYAFRIRGPYNNKKLRCDSGKLPKGASFGRNFFVAPFVGHFIYLLIATHAIGQMALHSKLIYTWAQMQYYETATCRSM